jgi:hypothetical protein
MDGGENIIRILLCWITKDMLLHGNVLYSRINPEGGWADAFVAALGTAAGAGEPAAIRKDESTLVADGRINDQPARRLDTFSNMLHVADHFFF